MTLLHQTPFDILYKDFFNTESPFNLLNDVKAHHPVDIYETEDGLTFEIACTGLTKEDVEIALEYDVLRIKYNKRTEDAKSTVKYLSKGIARRSFNLGWKIASRFDLRKAEAEMKNGLLTVTVPFSAETKPTTLTIK